MDGELYKKRPEYDLLMRCLSQQESMKIMVEVLEGVCGVHQAGRKMRWLTRRGWVVDLIGKIYPPYEQGHYFIIVVTDYFKKWAEAFPLKFVTQHDVIKIQTFTLKYGFEISHSTPYYAQDNGEAESTNKVLKNIIERMMMVRSTMVALQNQLSPTDYYQTMMTELKGLDEVRLVAFDHLQIRKQKVMKAYNRRVREKIFVVAVLVWKVVLIIGQRNSTYGKWSPSCEGPYQVT
ncbi:uncharacterized protein LOC119981875 [Tripterygium wilfordii]|uniref:uncharacterized protein LOC119981875 n=1 Tax=Tripterygium wilfordii TaxID=458696 RepID=UPI0018F80658|nr:uncharacterized protein LOC119981875 [Tripterygium wilfordii]